MDALSSLNLKALLQNFTKNDDETAKEIMHKCIELAKLDYNITVLDNTSGELGSHYPSELIIIESENDVSGDVIKNSMYEDIDSDKLRDLIFEARAARCQKLFPVPVIFYRGKFICRSATLSDGPEIYSRSGLDFLSAGDSANGNKVTEENSDQNNTNNWVLGDQGSKKDAIKLLKALNVGTIADFMVNKENVNFGLNVMSSEKVEKENGDSQFTLFSLPYPNCEFFKELHDQNYSSENLYHNWTQTHVNAEIIVPQDAIVDQMQVKWKEYKKWNLPDLTEKYLLLLLRYTFDSSNGLLVHSISGCDQTSLFISLLRICLWADGEAHKNLTPIQILYFTIAYDWLLFGHDSADRKSEVEGTLYFCFYFLKFVMNDEFSSQRCKGNTSPPIQPVTCSDKDVQCDGPEMENSGVLALCSQGSNHNFLASRNSVTSQFQEMPIACPTNEVIVAEEPERNCGCEGACSWCFCPAPTFAMRVMCSWFARLLPSCARERLHQIFPSWIFNNELRSRRRATSPEDESHQSLSPESQVTLPGLGPQSSSSSGDLEVQHIFATKNFRASSLNSVVAVTSRPSIRLLASASSPGRYGRKESLLRVVSRQSLSPEGQVTLPGLGPQSSSSSDDLEVQHLFATKRFRASSISPVAVASRPSFRQLASSSHSPGRGDASATDYTATLIDSQDTTKRTNCDDHSQCGSTCAMRRSRLEQIRKLFADCYCQSIGHNLKDENFRDQQYPWEFSL